MEYFKLCRFRSPQNVICVGMLSHGETSIIDLSSLGECITSLLNIPGYIEKLLQYQNVDLLHYDVSEVKLLAPIERQEVWAAGVTYLRSKTARMEESDFSASAYDRVYDADRPELFFKCLPEKVVTSDESVGIRKDSQWSVPEPELALMINPAGNIVGYLLGNDMSSRDIEGANLLYLPQAKIYNRSCAIAPFVVVGVDEETVRTWQVSLEVKRNGSVAFFGQTSPGQIKRSFQELVDYLFRSQDFPLGAVLFTGTGIVPPQDFTLKAGDEIIISCPPIGKLVNSVTVV